MGFPAFTGDLILFILLTNYTAHAVKTNEEKATQTTAPIVQKSLYPKSIQTQSTPTFFGNQPETSQSPTCPTYVPSLPPSFPIELNEINKTTISKPKTWIEILTFGYFTVPNTARSLEEEQGQELTEYFHSENNGQLTEKNELTQSYITTIHDPAAMENITKAVLETALAEIKETTDEIITDIKAEKQDQTTKPATSLPTENKSIFKPLWSLLGYK